jgi:hypothetical protein
MAAAGTGRVGGTLDPGGAAGSTGAGTELPGRELRLMGFPVWCPGADTDDVPSSLGAATATPVGWVPTSTTPNANAAAPARAPGLLTDIENPCDR